MSQLFCTPFTPAFGTTGQVASSAKLAFYSSSTSVLATVYSNAELTTPLDQSPNAFGTAGVAADISGRFPDIYMDDATVYRVVLQTREGAVIDEADPYTSPLYDFTLPAGSSFIGYLPGGDNATPSTVQSKLREWISPKDFGALGTNSGDDGAALTNAKSAFPTRLLNGAGGNYRITSNLVSGFRMLDGKITDTRTVTTQDDYSFIALGEGAGAANTFIPEQHPASGGRNFASGNHNIYVGWGAAGANTIGRRNTIVGSRAAISGTTFNYTTGFGSHVLENLTTGPENSMFGVQAGQNITTGAGNTGGGLGACNKVSTGSYNTGFGYSACGGASAAPVTGDKNTGVGYRALYFLTTGLDNCAFGKDALVSLTTGSSNVAAGGASLTNLETGSSNIGLGDSSLRFFTGSNTSAFGAESLFSLVSAIQNTAGGYQAGYNATGDGGAYFGYRAGFTVTSGTNNTCIGNRADTTATATNSTSLGFNAVCTGSNQVTLGDAFVTTLRCATTTITAISDARYKKNITPLSIPDEFFDELQMVSFEWIEEGMPEGRVLGVIAQQLDELQTRHGVEWLGLVDKSNPDRWEATPGKLLFLVIQRAQRLTAQIASIDERLKALEA